MLTTGRNRLSIQLVSAIDAIFTAFCSLIGRRPMIAQASRSRKDRPAFSNLLANADESTIGYSTFFKPWEGENYSRTNIFGLRMLILCESVYIQKNNPDPEYATINLVKWVCTGTRKRWTNYFLKVYHLAINDQNTSVTAFWDSVLFYEYIQAPLNNNRARPTPEMWKKAIEPFRGLLVKHEPEAVLVIGKELWSNLLQAKLLTESGDDDWAIEVPGAPTAVATFANHPSGMGLSDSKWQPIVSRLIERARATKKY